MGTQVRGERGQRGTKAVTGNPQRPLALPLERLEVRPHLTPDLANRLEESRVHQVTVIVRHREEPRVGEPVEDRRPKVVYLSSAPGQDDPVWRRRDITLRRAALEVSRMDLRRDTPPGPNDAGRVRIREERGIHQPPGVPKIEARILRLEGMLYAVSEERVRKGGIRGRTQRRPRRGRKRLLHGCILAVLSAFSIHSCRSALFGSARAARWAGI